ncbi:MULTISPECIES: hypothetical protein [Burkholderia cepacia complex]|uniref:hypothetical protein n=1 Tax=Burkholderia cepacia complex TaxID=87882 RepID=UPI0022EAD458|nr:MULTISPECIES: hypothetical protein [Burkholderia cepacia complex]MDA3672495.1 hypothetical protein [Burkholderia cenocepacia]MDA3681468.1 hypothetical protein [Burkholderia cenocepacia]MDA3689297.1 hypothetical protein [Burkholderia cenocepacia]MDA3696783.1 hypothetical protein [Burkholderia cenocepacia]MDA3704107.1 hypothetical protein [Burkholderia cenocepacia]
MLESLFNILTGIALTLNYQSINLTTPPANGAAIVFVNGVTENFDKAMAHRELLKYYFSKKFPHENYLFSLAYNFTQTSGINMNAPLNPISDIIYHLPQFGTPQFSMSTIGTILDISKIPYEKDAESEGWGPYWKKYQSLPIIDRASMLAESFPGIEGHIKEYQNYLSRYRKIVVVGHSQGALYANAAIEYILTEEIGVVDAKDRISSMNVGATTKNMPTINSSYVTSADDIVIALLTFFSNIHNNLAQNIPHWSVLPANYVSPGTNASDSSDKTGHLFETYLNPTSPTFDAILNNIARQAK